MHQYTTYMYEGKLAETIMAMGDIINAYFARNYWVPDHAPCRTDSQDAGPRQAGSKYAFELCYKPIVFYLGTDFNVILRKIVGNILQVSTE